MPRKAKPAPARPSVSPPQRAQEQKHGWYSVAPTKLDELHVIAEAQRRIEHKLLQSTTKRFYMDDSAAADAKLWSPAHERWQTYCECAKLLDLDGPAALKVEALARYFIRFEMNRQKRLSDRKASASEEAAVRKNRADKRADLHAKRERELNGALANLDARPLDAACLYHVPNDGPSSSSVRRAGWKDLSQAEQKAWVALNFAPSERLKMASSDQARDALMSEIGQLWDDGSFDHVNYLWGNHQARPNIYMLGYRAAPFTAYEECAASPKAFLP